MREREEKRKVLSSNGKLPAVEFFNGFLANESASAFRASLRQILSLHELAFLAHEVLNLEGQGILLRHLDKRSLDFCLVIRVATLAAPPCLGHEMAIPQQVHGNT